LFVFLDKRLLKLCAASRKYVFLCVLVKWLALVSNIVIILSAGSLISAIINRTPVNIAMILSIVAACLVAKFTCNILSAVFSHEASVHARDELRDSALSKILSLGMSYMEHTPSSGVIQLLGEGIETLENYFGRYLPQLFYSLIAPLTLFAVLSIISIKAAVVLLVCIPLIPSTIAAFMTVAKRIMKKYWASYSDLGNTFLENLQGLTTYKLFNADEERHRKANAEAENFRIQTMKLLGMQLNSITIMDLIAYGGAATGCLLAMLEFRAGIISIGGLFSVILLSADFFLPLRILGGYFHVAMAGVASSNKIFAILDIPDNAGKETVKVTHIDSIHMKGLTFAYQENTHALDDVTMRIQRNQFIGICGESGSGKSTVASLIMKMFAVDDGCLFVNEKEINHCASRDIAGHINFLSSHSHIFNTTIRENLLMAKRDADEAEMLSALKQARLDAFVASLPEGLDTHAGENAAFLSGGQRQRLALARTILSGRQVLILDEATSNIDSESEELIWNSINDLKGRKTILAISHRLKNLRNADRICLLKHGKLAESGTHEDMLAMKGDYYKLYTTQSELERVREASA
jgi:ATP-binding cassette subfamily C protein